MRIPLLGSLIHKNFFKIKINLISIFGNNALNLRKYLFYMTCNFLSQSQVFLHLPLKISHISQRLSSTNHQVANNYKNN